MIGAVLSSISATRLRNLFIVLFFGVQLSLAIPGLIYNKYETDGRFSWNMYAVYYPCRVKYELIEPDGQRTRINIEKFFNIPERLFVIFNRRDLPEFNNYVCAVVPRQQAARAIHASVVCKLNNRPPVEFIRQGVDICAQPNYGVVRP